MPWSLQTRRALGWFRIENPPCLAYNDTGALPRPPRRGKRGVQQWYRDSGVEMVGREIPVGVQPEGETLQPGG
jgi:hypothetical protein